MPLNPPKPPPTPSNPQKEGSITVPLSPQNKLSSIFDRAFLLEKSLMSLLNQIFGNEKENEVILSILLARGDIY